MVTLSLCDGAGSGQGVNFFRRHRRHPKMYVWGNVFFAIGRSEISLQFCWHSDHTGVRMLCFIIALSKNDKDLLLGARFFVRGSPRQGGDRDKAWVRAHGPWSIGPMAPGHWPMGPTGPGLTAPGLTCLFLGPRTQGPWALVYGLGAQVFNGTSRSPSLVSP